MQVRNVNELTSASRRTDLRSKATNLGLSRLTLVAESKKVKTKFYDAEFEL